MFYEVEVKTVDGLNIKKTQFFQTFEVLDIGKFAKTLNEAYWASVVADKEDGA